jgi:hypothetical protein
MAGPLSFPEMVCFMTGQQTRSKCDIDYTKVSKAALATKTIQSITPLGM